MNKADIILQANINCCIVFLHIITIYEKNAERLWALTNPKFLIVRYFFNINSFKKRDKLRKVLPSRKWRRVVC
jgi:hypothetical protein